MESTNESSVDLQPSKLGDKEHWEQAYEREQKNFLGNALDEGQIWFEESDAENRILRYLEDENLNPQASYLDVGTGNGHLLFELLQTGGFEGPMVGIDYSPKAIELARMVANKRGIGESLRFEVMDIIKDNIEGASWVPNGGFDVILDKGTYDAISLSEELLGNGKRVYEDYPKKVSVVLKTGGLLIVASCNWTEDELKQKMTAQCDLKYHGRIRYPSFSFGGKVGQTISTVCFKKA
ncbi:S-adenosyl-L-methionine-dependent methyltransferase [Geopyxis carbonaria]|nr:S-adenosyl-L-methionine-dependent methyltransferase [Geopyxis carbonaria]